MKKDDLFKLLLLIILGLFLFTYYNQSQIGRFQFRNESSRTVIDTKTGSVYIGGKLEHSIR